MMQFQKNARTEERTEGQTLFDTTLPTTTGGQKKDPFYGWGSCVSRLQSRYKKTVYFLPVSLQKFLGLLTPGLGIQCLNHLAITMEAALFPIPPSLRAKTPKIFSCKQQHI